MRVAIRRIPILLIALTLAAPAMAQFGHPLKGTWSGDWSPTKDSRTHIVLELNWDGKAITGNINPGPKAVAIQKATLDPATWGVRIEGDGKDTAGTPVHYTIDGKLENIGAYQRVMTGSWTQGGVRGDFKVVRK